VTAAFFGPLPRIDDKAARATSPGAGSPVLVGMLAAFIDVYYIYLYIYISIYLSISIYIYIYIYMPRIDDKAARATSPGAGSPVLVGMLAAFIDVYYIYLYIYISIYLSISISIYVYIYIYAPDRR